MSDPFEKFKKKLKETTSADSIEIEDHSKTKLEETIQIETPPSDQTLEYVFFPRKDITTYDLARILSITQLMISPDIYQKFPEDLQKYFIKFKEIINN